MACDRDALYAHALGGLPAPEHDALDRHVDRCAPCRAELDHIQAALVELAAALEPVPPPAHLRNLVLTSVRRARFADLTDRLAELVDVDPAGARSLLARIDLADAWEPGPVPGTALLHFQGGPSTAGADTGFVRVEAGITFPWHSHRGEERCLVLEGVCVDSSGATYRRGDRFTNPPDSAHDFRATETGDLVFAVVVGGVDFDAVPPGAG